MKQFILLGLLAIGLPSMATVECRTSNTGTTYCTGTDSTGKQVNTESRTSNTGTTYTTGQYGGQQIHQECRTANTGTTYCN